MDPNPKDPEVQELSNLQFVENLAFRDGYDRLSFWEQKICWGDLDSFRSVTVRNQSYMRIDEQQTSQQCPLLCVI